MPIYEYACQKCGKVVEVLQKTTDRSPGKCEKCGGKLARVLSNTSFQLKGGGWYKDLYSTPKPESSSEGSSGETSSSETSSSETPSAKEAPAVEAKAETPKPVAAKPEPEKKKAPKKAAKA